MAHITGLKVLGREVQPGDEIMNEWTQQVMEVQSVKLVENTSVELHCIKPDGRKEVIHGGWEGVTRLVTRKIAAYAPDFTPEEIKVRYAGQGITTSYKPNRVVIEVTDDDDNFEEQPDQELDPARDGLGWTIEDTSIR